MTLAVGAAATLGVSGADQYSVSGSGNLSFYGPAESELGVGGDWASYTASITGSVSITLTTSSLILNGRTLPAGTYTITTTAAALAGSGAMTSPDFAGSASVKATDGTLELGPSTGSVTLAGKALNTTVETTLDGYSGTLSVTAGGNGTDSVTINGSAGNALEVAPSLATLTTNQNTPIAFAAERLDQPCGRLHPHRQRTGGMDGLDRRRRQSHGHAGGGRSGRLVSDPGHCPVQDRSQPRGADDRERDDHGHQCRSCPQRGVG